MNLFNHGTLNSNKHNQSFLNICGAYKDYEKSRKDQKAE